MDYIQVAPNLASTILVVGLGIGWLWNRLDKKFDKIDFRLDRIEGTLRSHGERLAHIERAF